MKPVYLVLTFGIVAALALSACGATTPTPVFSQPIPTDLEIAPVETETPLPTDEPAPTSIPEANPYWREYRDARYGYGLALPCFWIFTPTPAEGNLAALTTRNFSNEFRQANSTKGNWEWSNGSLALDIIVIEGIPTDLNLMDAVNWIATTYPAEGQVVSSLVESQAGQHPIAVSTLANESNPDDTTRVIYMRLAPDKMFMLAVYPQAAWEYADLNGILASIALTPADAVAFPSFDPASPPDDSPLACP